MVDFSDIIGLTIDEALPKVADRGINAIRPTVVDGEIMFGTTDMRTDRLNVSLTDGVISSIGRIK